MLTYLRNLHIHHEQHHWQYLHLPMNRRPICRTMYDVLLLAAGRNLTGAPGGTRGDGAEGTVHLAPRMPRVFRSP
jgi:hypothetical protein